MEDGSQLRIDPIHFWNPGIVFVLSFHIVRFTEIFMFVDL